MPGEFYFMALGGIGVSLAGFAGLIAALDRRDGPLDAIQAWRIRNIVIGGFLVTTWGFGTIALYLIFDDVETTARVSSGVLAVMTTVRGAVASRPGPAWSEERQRSIYRAVGALVGLLCLANTVIGSVGFLAVLALLAVSEPLSIFMGAVTDVTADERAS